MSSGLGLGTGTLSPLSCSIGEVATKHKFKGRAQTLPLNGKSVEEFGGHGF